MDPMQTLTGIESPINGEDAFETTAAEADTQEWFRRLQLETDSLQEMNLSTEADIEEAMRRAERNSVRVDRCSQAARDVMDRLYGYPRANHSITGDGNDRVPVDPSEDRTSSGLTGPSAREMANTIAQANAELMRPPIDLDAPMFEPSFVTVPSGPFSMQQAMDSMNRIRAKIQIDELMPLILERLRKLAPTEAQAIAGEAAASRPLDGVSLMALADWLRDQRFDGLADHVASLKGGDDQLLIFQAAVQLDPEQSSRVARDIRKVCGKDTAVVVLPPGIKLVGVTKG